MSRKLLPACSPTKPKCIFTSSLAGWTPEPVKTFSLKWLLTRPYSVYRILAEQTLPCPHCPGGHPRQGGLPKSGQSFWNAHLSSNNGKRGEGPSGLYSGRVSILLVLCTPPVTKLIFLGLAAVMRCGPCIACWRNTICSKRCSWILWTTFLAHGLY